MANKKSSKIPQQKKQNRLDVTWKWFEFHANQRFSAFYYYLITIGALSWGFITCINKNSNLELLALLISFLGFIVSYVFLHLEIRNVELVNIGREALRKENFLPAEIDYETNPKGKYAKEKFDSLNEAIIFPLPCRLCFIKEAFVLHNFCFRLIYISTILISFSAFAYSLFSLRNRFSVLTTVMNLFAGDHFIGHLIILLLMSIIIIASLFCLLCLFSSHWARKSFIREYIQARVSK